MQKKSIVITLDGPSGSGKSTVASALARELGYRYLDTGAMYRAVTLAVLNSGLSVDPVDEHGISQLLHRTRIELDDSGRIVIDGQRLDDEALRVDSVTKAVSNVSALNNVRERLVALQREFARGGDIVAEGRDLGSVVFPTAFARYYLDADPEVRARRRAQQESRCRQDNKPVDERVVLQAIRERDQKDRRRELAPLILAPGVELIDTNALTWQEVVASLVNRVQKRLNCGLR